MKLRYIIFILFNLVCITTVTNAQTQYENIKVSDVNEFGYKLYTTENYCWLQNYLKVTNTTDSILIIAKEGVLPAPGYLYKYTVLRPGYSFLIFNVRDIASEYYSSGRQKISLPIYKMDTTTYYDTYLNKNMKINIDSFKRQDIYFQKNVSGLIRSLSKRVDTTILKQCTDLYNEFRSWSVTSRPDTNKIEIQGASEFGFELYKHDLGLSEFKVGDIYYDHTSSGCQIKGLFTIKNTSLQTIHIDSIVFDVPKRQIYDYQKIKHNKDGSRSGKGKIKLIGISKSADFVNGSINMDNYYVPPGCSAAYRFSYAVYIKVEDIYTQEHFLEVYNKLPGHICFSDGTTMSFVLKFDAKDLLMYPKSFK